MADRLDYGLDAPRVVTNLVILGAAALLAGILAGIADVWLLSAWGLATGSSMLGTALLMAWGSRVGKRRFAERAVRAVRLNGDERILDVGCGHGLILITASKRLDTGWAIGVDIWSQHDQADNHPAATLRNACLEGVRNRVRLCSGDARALPFADASFDVVASSLAIHNIATRRERAQAFHEIARVVRRGGRVLIIDIGHATEYARALRDVHFGDIRLSRPHFMFLVPMRVLTATLHGP
jgi:arsenite methyltransferase